MIVRVRGKVYRDVKHAAKALGVTTSAVYTAILRGKEDRLGLKDWERKGGLKPKVWTWGKYSWPSRAAASRALGMSSVYISQLVGRGTPEMWEIYERRMREWADKHEEEQRELERIALEETAELEREAYRARLHQQRSIGFTPPVGRKNWRKFSQKS